MHLEDESEVIRGGDDVLVDVQMYLPHQPSVVELCGARRLFGVTAARFGVQGFRVKVSGSGFAY